MANETALADLFDMQVEYLYIVPATKTLTLPLSVSLKVAEATPVHVFAEEGETWKQALHRAVALVAKQRIGA